jgi:hypothetical protein
VLETVLYVSSLLWMFMEISTYLSILIKMEKMNVLYEIKSKNGGQTVPEEKNQIFEKERNFGKTRNLF